MSHEPCHEEVLRVLEPLGDRAFGERIRRDRGSALQYLGIPAPALRKAVARGFSFYDLPEKRVLSIWNALWRRSPFGDVLFAALEYYGPIVRKRVDPHLWPVVRGWRGRVDNWAHADGLAGLYSRILERRPDEVHPQLEVWNRSQGEWLRRISLVSLIHYTGGNAVFLPPGKVLPFVTACLADERHYVQTAVGWVLREMGRAYPERIKSYVEANAERLRPAALARATERWPAPERTRLRAARKQRTRRSRPSRP